MFKFVNEYNKKYYNEINRNILSKMHEDECIKNCKEILNCDFENSGIDRIYIQKRSQK